MSDTSEDDEGATRATVANTAGGGPVSCDTGEAGMLTLSASPCSPCAQCAIQARCADETARCPAWATGTTPDPEIPCDVFQACIDGCFDLHDTNNNGTIEAGEAAAFDACAGVDASSPPGTCIGDTPNGWDDYLGLLSCIICQECVNNCDGVNSCG